MTEYQKAMLVGRRLVTASEVTHAGRLNEELIKALTGQDTINARHPYGRPFQYVPVAKFFLRVNEKPIIRDQSHGMWRRVKLVPSRNDSPSMLGCARTCELRPRESWRCWSASASNGGGMGSGTRRSWRRRRPPIAPSPIPWDGFSRILRHR